LEQDGGDTTFPLPRKQGVAEPLLEEEDIQLARPAAQERNFSPQEEARRTTCRPQKQLRGKKKRNVSQQGLSAGCCDENFGVTPNIAQHNNQLAPSNNKTKSKICYLRNPLKSFFFL